MDTRFLNTDTNIKLMFGVQFKYFNIVDKKENIQWYIMLFYISLIALILTSILTLLSIHILTAFN